MSRNVSVPHVTDLRSAHGTFPVALVGGRSSASFSHRASVCCLCCLRFSAPNTEMVVYCPPSEEAGLSDVRFTFSLAKPFVSGTICPSSCRFHLSPPRFPISLKQLRSHPLQHGHLTPLEPGCGCSSGAQTVSSDDSVIDDLEEYSYEWVGVEVVITNASC